MKKAVSLILVIMLLLAGTACSATKPVGMTIQPSKFSEETLKVLELFDKEVQFFDITLDETVKSHTMSVWVYRDGAWHEDGQVAGEREFLSGQIAIRLTENSYDLYVIDESGHIKYGYPVLETDFEHSLGIGGSMIDQEIPIELHKEIPIWVKIGTDKNSMRMMDITEDFRNYDCNAGVAVTLTVSDEVVE